MTKRKVYCEECKRLVWTADASLPWLSSTPHCFLSRPGTWLSKKDCANEMANPKLKNQNNDCKDYVEKDG